MKSIDISKEDLKQLYVIEGKNQQEIADIYKCSVACISIRLKKYNLRKCAENFYIGKKFGLLTPLKAVDRDEHGHMIFKCLCDCGNTINVRNHALKSGNTKTCGCKSRKRGRDHPLYRGYEDIQLSYWTSLVKGAELRNIYFDITIEYAWQLFLDQGRKCALSGAPIFLYAPRKNMAKKTASLDRIDSSKGYEKGNVQWVHKTVNRMKFDFEQDEFLEWCQKIANYN